MADLWSGAAAGFVVGELGKYFLQNFQNGRQFVPTLEMNEETLNALTPLVEQIKNYSDLLDRPREELERLETHIREGKELVRECKKKLSPWKFLCFSHYQTKLKKFDEAFERYLNVNVQVEIKRDLMEVKADLKLFKEILMRMTMKNLCGAQIWGLSGNSQIWGLWGVPEEPGQFLGMDEPLNNLKIEMMKDGVSVHVLTGMGGLGKTTLAKKLCWDSQIKGKFGGNIFFITISTTPNLKNIVKTLFQHCGLKVPEFHNDEDAINRLRFLLSEIGKNPILVVLDGVRPGSERLVESFVEMLKIQMLDCKILVTSREVPFTRFGTPYELYPLHHDHAVSLFLHFAQLNHSSSYMPDQDLVHEIVKGCKGSPLALQVIAGSLCQQPFEKWQNMKECLTGQMFYDCIERPFFTTHVPHGELAIHQSNWEPFEQRQIINLNGDNRPAWWIGQNQQGIISYGDNGIMKDIVLWRRKKLNTMIIVAATVKWVLMEVYQFNFLTLISWLTIFVAASMFFYSNMLTLLGKKPPNLLRLELKEETAVRMAKTVRAWIEKSIKWLFIVSTKEAWPVSVGVMAGLLAISYVGNCMDFLTFIYTGILAGMTLPVTYIRNKDKIKRSRYWMNFSLSSSNHTQNKRKKNRKERKKKSKRCVRDCGLGPSATHDVYTLVPSQEIRGGKTGRPVWPVIWGGAG